MKIVCVQDITLPIAGMTVIASVGVVGDLIAKLYVSATHAEILLHNQRSDTKQGKLKHHNICKHLHHLTTTGVEGITIKGDREVDIREVGVQVTITTGILHYLMTLQTTHWLIQNASWR